MMNSIVEIHPKELKFVVELKKQSSCSIRLTNKSDHHVAFKVKTTSPKKYCVRPNVGVISPKSVCEFSVTMQAPKTALPDMDCKDKFLIQSTAVSSETTDADITASMFAKDEGKYVEERKLRVILISPPNSPILSPIKGDLKQGEVHEASVLDDQVFGGMETLPQHKMVTGDVKFSVVNSEESKPTKESEVKPAKHVELEIRQEEEMTQGKDVGLKQPKYEELEAIKDVESKATNAVHIEPAKDVELKSAKVVELEPAKDMNAKIVESKSSEDLLLKLSKDVDADKAQVVEGLKLVKDIKEMKSKLLELELKLSQAQVTISTLTEERGSSNQEIKDLKEQLSHLMAFSTHNLMIGSSRNNYKVLSCVNSLKCSLTFWSEQIYYLGHLSKGGVQRVEFPVIIGCTVALFSVLLVTAIAIKSLCMKVASSL